MYGELGAAALILGRQAQPIEYVMFLFLAALGSFLVFLGKRSIRERSAKILFWFVVSEYTGKPAVFIGCVQLFLGIGILLMDICLLIYILD